MLADIGAHDSYHPMPLEPGLPNFPRLRKRGRWGIVYFQNMSSWVRELALFCTYTTPDTCSTIKTQICGLPPSVLLPHTREGNSKVLSDFYFFSL